MLVRLRKVMLVYIVTVLMVKIASVLHCRADNDNCETILNVKVLSFLVSVNK